MEEEQFKMKCPKCHSTAFTVQRDQRSYAHKSQPFELVFSCRCGTQLFGDQIQKEYDRQKAVWMKGSRVAPVVEVNEDALLREQEEERRKNQLREAMEYRRKYLAEKRAKQAEEERLQKEEEDRRWREKVALVESEGNFSPRTKPSHTTRNKLEPIRVPAPRPAAPPKPKPTRASPAPVARTKPATPPKVTANGDVDPNHPHAEFLALMNAGGFQEHFPNCTTPDQKSADLCVWPPCENPRRKKSKYCSRECSNKNARWRHKMRKKK